MLSTSLSESAPFNGDDKLYTGKSAPMFQNVTHGAEAVGLNHKIIEGQ